MDILRALDWRRKKRKTLREAVGSLSPVHVAIGAGGVVLGLGALWLTLSALRLRARREMEAMDTTMLIRAFGSAREAEKANIATFCMSRVHELRQLLFDPTSFPAYQSGVRDLLKRILVVVSAKDDSDSRKAQIEFLERALKESADDASIQKAHARAQGERIIPGEEPAGSLVGGVHAMYGHVSTWDVREVRHMDRWFANPTGGEGADADFSFWDTRKVVSMMQMFEGSPFNGEIGTWDTVSLTHAYGTFRDANEFNGDIGGWNTSALQNTDGMFEGASSFNHDIGGWNTSALAKKGGMFSGASSFNQDIGGWNTGAVTDMSYMFSGASSFNQDIARWNTGAVKDMRSMFSGAIKFSFGKQVAEAWKMDASRDAGLVLDAQFGSRHRTYV